MMSTETWWDQIEAYNNAIFPMQIIIVVVAAVLTYFLFTKPSTKTNNMMKAYLSFTFAWNGIIFFLIFGKELPGTFLGAPLCILIAILFVWDIFANRTQFRLPDIKCSWGQFLNLE